MNTASLIWSDWLDMSSVLKPEKKRAKAAMCLCCKHKPRAQGRRGLCMQCWNIFAYKLRKFIKAKERKQWEREQIAAGRVLKGRPGRTPRPSPFDAPTNTP